MKNHAQDRVEKLAPDLFRKSQYWAYLWTHTLKFHAVCFIVCPNRWLAKIVETKMLTSFFYKGFLKNKKRSGTSLPDLFSAWFLKNLAKFYCLLVFTSFILSDIGQYVYCNYLFSIWDVINFEINLSFLIKSLFYIT